MSKYLSMHILLNYPLFIVTTYQSFSYISVQVMVICHAMVYMDHAGPYIPWHAISSREPFGETVGWKASVIDGASFDHHYINNLSD